MREPTLTLSTSQLKIYDEVLLPGNFLKLWKLMNVIPYKSILADQWIRVWNVTDGSVLRSYPLEANRSGAIRSSKYGKIEVFFGDLIAAILCTLQGHEVLSQITKLVLTPYVWPPKSSISWHSDGKNSRGRVGAFTFYAHKEWNAEWGGELLVSHETGVGAEAVSVFDNREVSDKILQKGHGIWVAPKPNRLIVLSDATLHKVAKTTENAAPRLTIQGFLYRDQ